MKRCVQFMIACCCLLTIVSCGSNHHSQPLALLTADSLFTDHPDSALLLLAEIAAEAETWPREDRMQYYLLRNRAEEKCHILHDNDSAMQEAVRYFDKHGSSQERALAWFELGRVYDEMQLTGDAINAYNHSQGTDTLSTDSAVLSIRARAVNQIGQVNMYQDLYRQSQPHFRKAIQLGELAGDTVVQIYALRNLARSHVALEQYEQGVAMFKKAAQMALEYDDAESFQTIQVELSDTYLNLDDLPRMKASLDACHSLQTTDSCILTNQYANYYLAIGNLDSAAILFRQGLDADNPYVQRDAMLNSANILAERQQYREAFELLSRSIAHDDSLTAVEKGQHANLIATLNKKLDNERRQDAKLRRQDLIIIALSLFLLGIMLFAYFTIQHKNLLNRLQREKADKLMQELREAQQQPRPSRVQGARAFTETTLYANFHDPRFVPKLADYNALEDALNTTYDGCIEKVRQLNGKIKDKEIMLCMLEKAKVPNKLICAFLGMEPNALSMMRSRLYYKLFKRKGTADLFHEFISTL